MKIAATLSVLLGFFCQLHAGTSVAVRSLADEVLKTPRSSPLQRSAEQVVYLYATGTVKEGGRGKGMIELRYPELSPVVFRLENNPDKVIKAPAKVTLPGGVTQVTFDFTVRNDSKINLTRTTYLSLRLGNYEFGSLPITILDDEKAPKLALYLPNRISEGATAFSTGFVTLDRPADVDLKVQLDQNPKGRVNCPKQVTIRARKTTSKFNISALNDKIINGDASITLAASALGISPVSTQTVVVDDEPLNLRLKLPSEVVEGTAASGSVELSGRTTKELTVTLKNGNPARLDIPTTVTIPAGRSSGSFELFVNDTSDSVSTTNVSIQATAPNFIKASGTISVREIALNLRVKSLNLATNDLLWDRHRQLVYASVPATAGEPYGNHVVAIDPVTRAITASLAVNQDPGQLAITSGGEYLYVARKGNGSIMKIALSSFTESQVFAIGTDQFYGTLYAEDICTVAGQPDLLVVSQYRKSASPRHNGVVVYDNGVARAVKTRDHTGSNVIEPSADPNIFFGYNTETTEFGFRRIQLGPTGLTELSVNGNLLSGFGLDIRSDGDRVYSNDGVALDGNLSAIRGSFPLTSSTNLVCPDLATNRVYFMETDSSYSSQYGRIVTYDPITLLPIHRVTLPQPANSPGSFIRWGDFGLAYRTAGAVVFVTDKELVPGGPPADLTVTVQATPNPATVSGKLTYTINVTNAGPNSAENLVLNASLSSRQSVFSTSATKGIRQVSGLNVSLYLASLAVGATETLTVVTTPLSAGSLTCTAGVSSEAIDPNSANNVGFKLISVGFQTAINKVNELNLKANNIVADPKRQLLWASIPGSVAAPLGKSVVSIDPLTGTVSDPLPINASPAPGAMALSPSGRYLYIGLADAPEVHRIDLDTDGYPAVRIPLGLNQWGGANYAQDIEVLDGDGTSFIFAGSGDHAAAIFDGTVRRQDRTSIYSVDSLARTGSSGVFIGYNNYSSGFDLSRLSATPTGVSTLSKISNVVRNYGVTIVGDGNFVLSTSGRLVDSLTLTLIADLAVSGTPCVDAANQRAYIVTGPTLSAFNAVTGNPVGTMILRTTGTSDWPQQCIRWGTDGFAVLGNDGTIAIARWSLAVPAAPAARALLAAAAIAPVDPKLDSDGDGLSDTLEYLFGTSPTAVTAQPLKLTRLPAPGAATLHLTFPRRSGVTRPAYAYQTSGDLLQWNTTENVTETVLSSQITDGVATETIDAAIPVPHADANFVRILWQP